MNAIYTRRSIRKYTNEPVADEKLIEFIKAGMNAPSASNEQPWQFIIINDRKILDKIPEFHPFAAMLHQAPAAILVCGDLSLEKNKGYWMIDCSAATENILLEIADQGFGGVWLGVYPREERMKSLKDLLSIPDGIIPFALITVGHPAEHKAQKNVMHPERIKYNKWG